MAVYETNFDGKKVTTEGVAGTCWCGKPAETEIQIGWIPQANGGAGGGKYEEICSDCASADEASEGQSC